MKKYKSILILVIFSLLPLLFTATIPYLIPTKLHLDSTKSNQHIFSGSKLYKITLEEGSQYTIDVVTDPFWGLDVSLRIGETPYMINGFSVDSGSSSGETMHFTASKTGDYYIKMKDESGSGYFDISVESGTVGSATGSNVEFFNISYLLVLILPSVFIIAVGMLVLMQVLRKRTSVPQRMETYNAYKRSKKPNMYIFDNKETRDDHVEKEDMVICEYCGAKFNKSLKKCPNCYSYLK